MPHVWVGHRNLLLHDLLTHDFVTDDNQAGTTTPVATTTVPITDSTTSTAPMTTTTAPTTTTTQPDPFASGDRVNVLLLGSDAGIGRTGVRTDTMIVISVDPDTGWTAMFEVFPATPSAPPSPKTTPHMPCGPMAPGAIPQTWHGCVRLWARQPAAVHRGQHRRRCRHDDSRNLLGLDVDHFAMVDLQGFADIIDASVAST